MKIEKKLLMVGTFIGALVVLLLIFYFITRFESGIKDIIGAVYFTLWITAVIGVWLYILQPYLKDRSKKKAVKGSASPVQRTGPVPSPRSNLPLRDRIREYVAERRKEEGLPVPEPLLPSRTTSSSGKVAASSESAGRYTPPVRAATKGADASIPASDAGDLPLPDDFDESDGGDLFGDDFSDGGDDSSLPGIEDDDFGSYDEPGVDEKPVTETGDLPEFDGDLDDDMSVSDFTDSISDDFAAPDEPAPDAQQEDDSGLSEEGLSDFDMPIDEGMMDEDLSDDSDLSEIEFEDLEPDEV